MPRLDTYHQRFAKALESEGWEVSKKPFSLRIGRRNLFPDLLAWKGEIRRIVVEIKGFNDDYSLTHQLAEAVGQYMLYRLALELKGLSLPVYLAIPKEASEGIFNEPLGRNAMQRFEIKLIVVDVQLEKIVEWKD